MVLCPSILFLSNARNDVSLIHMLSDQYQKSFLFQSILHVGIYYFKKEDGGFSKECIRLCGISIFPFREMFVEQSERGNITSRCYCNISNEFAMLINWQRLI